MNFVILYLYSNYTILYLFNSFVQEFVASPLDGTSLLLEVLRAIQLSQTINNNFGTASATIQRNSQSYQRRALLDELACL